MLRSVRASAIQGDTDWSVGCPQSSPMRALEANIKTGHVLQTTDHLKLTLPSSDHPANALVLTPPRVNKQQQRRSLILLQI